jgi:hypothetical protein
MSFLSPLLLLGAAAVGLPIILHFLFKAWSRPVQWAAMEFLRKAMEETSRKIRFRELILLFLRCLCLVLLALALARPIVGWKALAGRSESVDAVLLLDTSYSMGAKDGDKSRFERSVDQALSVIDNLPTGSTVQVVACSDRATTIPFTPTNLDQARNVVKSLKLTSHTGDLSPGLAEAATALDRVVGTNKEVYVFTDLQRNCLDGAGAAKAAELNARGFFAIVPSHQRTTDDGKPRNLTNVAITDITFPDAIPHSGTRLPFTVLVKNTGKTPISNVAVSLAVDGSETETNLDTGLAPLIQPGATYPVTMSAPLSKPGIRMLTARVGMPEVDAAGRTTASISQPDDLPGDNRFDKLILVREKIRVLVIDGRPDLRDSKDSAAHFISNAISPVIDTQKDGYFIVAKVVTADLAVNEQLRDYQICVLADVPADATDKPGIPTVGPEFVAKLTNFVSNGGGLIIGCGPFVVPASYNRVFGIDGAKLLPVELADLATTRPEAPYKPAPDTIQEPSFLSRLRTEPFNTATAVVDVFAVIGAKEEPNSPSHIVMRLDNQKPLVSAKSVGSGEVILFHTSLDTTWTNWPGATAGTSYVAAVRYALSHLTGREGRGWNRVAGQSIVWQPTEAATDFEVLRPDGSRVRLGPAVGGTEGTKLSVVVPNTATAGEYRIAALGQRDDDLPRFAVVPDLRESDNLESLTDTELDAKLGFHPVMTNASGGAETVGKIRSNREWTIWVLLALFLFGACETIWAWYCGRAV